MTELNTIKAAIIGHAVGDALGVPAEFIPREKLKKHPVTDMIGFGSHDVPKGSWSDDTSMELCTLNSIATKGKIDLDDIMIEFGKWVEDGYMTPQGRVFDIGRTCLHAIMNYHRGKDVRHCGGEREYDNGNGSLMRILPVCLYNYLKKADKDSAIDNIHSVSALTHAHDRSCIACGIYDFILHELISTPRKSSVKKALAKAKEYYKENDENKSFSRLYEENFELAAEKDIKSSGYVVDTLEAAVWCLLNTTNYKECVLKAVNLGQDTDTVAAVAGGLAGILYGYKNIPSEWIDSLIKKDDILDMCSAFYDAVIANGK